MGGTTAMGPLDCAKRVVVTAVALALAYIPTLIPCPGIVLSPSQAQNADLVVHFSFGATGFRTVLTALVCLEVLKLASPRISTWLAAASDNRYILNRWGIGFALLLAICQGWGVAAAIEDLPAAEALLVPEPGTLFKLSFVVSQAAGVAILAALSNVITRHGIGSGYWVMLTSGEVAALPGMAKDLMRNVMIGQINIDLIWLLAIAVVASVAASVWLYRSLAAGQNLLAEDLIWPPIAGYSVATVLYGFPQLYLFVSGQTPSPGFARSPDEPAWLFLLAASITLIAFFREGAALKSHPAQTSWYRAAIISLGTVAVIVPLEVFSVLTHVDIIRGDLLIAIVLVCLSFYAACANKKGRP